MIWHEIYKELITASAKKACYSFVPKEGFRVTFIEEIINFEYGYGYEYEYVFYLQTPDGINEERLKTFEEITDKKLKALEDLEKEGVTDDLELDFDSFAQKVCRLIAMDENEIKEIFFRAIKNKTGFKIQTTTFQYVSEPIPFVYLFTYLNGRKLYLEDTESNEWNKFEDMLCDEDYAKKYNKMFENEGVDLSNSKTISRYTDEIREYAFTIELI